MNLFVFALALLTTVHAQTKSIDNCAAFFEEMAGPTFEIDEASSRDLEIDQVLMPALGPHLRTSIGRARLRYLLHHPSLDRQTIVDRQLAIKALADDTIWRRQVRESLARVETAIGSRFEDLTEQLRSDRKSSLPWLQGAMGGVSAGAWGSVHLALQTNLVDPLTGIAGLLLGVAASIPNLGRQEQLRKPLHPFKRVFKTARQALDGFETHETASLNRIAETFRSLETPNGRLDLYETNKKVKWLAGDLIATFMSLAYLSNRGTHTTREALLDHHDDVRGLLSMIGELDVLMGLAELYDRNRERLSFPNILPEDHPTRVSITEGHHPFVWLDDPEGSVANDLELRERGEAPRFLLLTGPNTGGKSTYLKMIGLNILLAQIGAPVPAQAMSLSPTALFSNVKVGDELKKGQSFFEAQCRRVADIMGRAKAHRHVLVLMDEILTGTSPEEHTAIEQAIIRYFVNSKYVALLATHDRKLQSLEDSVPGVVNIHVDEKANQTYRIQHGPSHHRNAIQVLRDAGVDSDVCDAAQDYLNSHP